MKNMNVSDTADRECAKFLDALKRGWIIEAEKSLNELERLYDYANCCPSKRGFGKLLHCMRQLLTDHLLKTPEGQRGFPNLVEE